MRRPSAPPPAVLGLVAAAAATAGAVTALITLPAPGPVTLTEAPPATSLPVTSRDWADDRPVQLSLQTGAPRELLAPRGGVLTALACSVGQPVASGDVVATVDGTAVTALATTTPLWRDLALGDTGPDVTALQTELARLGPGPAADGVVGPATVRAVTTFLAARGEELPLGSAIPAHAFAWVPETEVTVAGCTATVGSVVEAGDVLLEFPLELESARVAPMPQDAAPGPRSVSVEGATVPVGEDGTVSDADGLARLAGTPSYAAAVSDTTAGPSLGARWALTEAMTVSVVAPTALWDVDGGTGCVEALAPGQTRGTPVLVDVAGSQLGQSFVRAVDGRELVAVAPEPDTGASCR